MSTHVIAAEKVTGVCSFSRGQFLRPPVSSINTSVEMFLHYADNLLLLNFHPLISTLPAKRGVYLVLVFCFPHSFCIYELEFVYKEQDSFLSYVSTDSRGFIPQVIIHSHMNLFCWSHRSSVSHRKLSGCWFLYPFTHRLSFLSTSLLASNTR